MLKYLVFATFMMSSVGWSAKLVDVKNYQEEGRFVSEMIFDQPISSDSLSVDFINETVQVDVPGGVVPSGKMHREVDDTLVRSTFTYQADGNTLRNRIIYKGIPAESFADKVDLVSSQNSLKVIIGEKMTAAVATRKMSSEPNKSLPKTKPKTLGSNEKDGTKKEDIASGESTEALLAEMDESQKLIDLDAGKEEESIPVLLQSVGAKEAEANPFTRMILSLLIVGGIAIIALLVLKRWKRNAPLAGSGAQIKVLTQHHLGTKKSLAIIRVAGESILIGITDHNISMIKSLSLLDEEIPDEVPQDFSGVLGKLGSFSRSTTKTGSSEKKKKTKAKGDDDFSIEGIKDIVSNRLKDMRSID